MMTPAPAGDDKPRLSTLRTGVGCRCPRCGEGKLFKGFLTLDDACSECGLDFGFADPADGPAFFGMSAIGLLAMVVMMTMEFTLHPPIWLNLGITFAVAIGGCLAILRPLKGWMVAEQYVHQATESSFSSKARPDQGE